MAQAVLVLILILGGANAFARDAQREPNEVRELTFERRSIRDLIPKINELKCNPRCTGQSNACGRFEDSITCLDNAQIGCFWACE